MKKLKKLIQRLNDVSKKQHSLVTRDTCSGITYAIMVIEPCPPVLRSKTIKGLCKKLLIFIIGYEKGIAAAQWIKSNPVVVLTVGQEVVSPDGVGRIKYTLINGKICVENYHTGVIRDWNSKDLSLVEIKPRPAPFLTIGREVVCPDKSVGRIVSIVNTRICVKTFVNDTQKWYSDIELRPVL